MIKGTHNALTGYPLKGWQRYFKWFIQPFCQCQEYDIFTQYRRGVRFFEIQCAYKNGKLIGSHGIAWYNSFKVDYILSRLNNMSITNKDVVYIILGLDNHNNTKDDCLRFIDYIDLVKRKYPNLTLIYGFIEKPWTVIQVNINLASQIYYGYWRLNWVKEKCKHWWQFYYYLPIPRLWKWIYGKKWDKEAEESGKMFYLTDFV